MNNSQNKKTCLIIEDALFLQEVYKFLFKNEAYEVLDIVSDGVDALVKINQYKPDLVILDLVLPLKNGLDVLKEISKISPNSKCLVVSALDENEITQQALALGAIKFIHKPFTKVQMLDAINEVFTSFSEVQNG